MREDTIVAVSTPPGHGGLGVVRLSGRDAAAIALRLFRQGSRPDGARRISISRRPVPRMATFGSVVDPEDGEFLDEAVLTYFPAPRSYTREDVVEIACHGSPVLLDRIVSGAVRAGARRARAGEFTLRAYLNGRIDILQAEAVNDLIGAVSLDQARLSGRQLTGSLSRSVAALRDDALAVLGDLEAAIEFPDDVSLPKERIRSGLEGLAARLESLVGSYEAGRALSEGVTLAILGRPNAGKSTLFNALLGEERAIVTPHPGTTRDFLRERLVVDGAVFHLVDMAGIGPARHPAAKAGVDRGLERAKTADGLLLLFDASRPAAAADRALAGRFPGKPAVVVLNKIDLPSRWNRGDARSIAGRRPVVEVSALRGTNLGPLKKAIRRTFVPAAAGTGGETILHARQRDLLAEMLDAAFAPDVSQAGASSRSAPAWRLSAPEFASRASSSRRSRDISQSS